MLYACIRCEDLCFSSGRFETVRFCALKRVCCREQRNKWNKNRDLCCNSFAPREMIVIIIIITRYMEAVAEDYCGVDIFACSNNYYWRRVQTAECVLWFVTRDMPNLLIIILQYYVIINERSVDINICLVGV